MSLTLLKRTESFGTCLSAFLFVTAQILLLSSVSLADDAVIEKGKSIYNGAGACASCHGTEGKGDGPAAVALEPKPRSFASADFALDTDGDGKKGTEKDLLNVITNGAQKYGGSVMMVGRPDLSEDDRNALVKFVMSLKQ